MLLRLTATQFVKEMKSGRTSPILCGCADVGGRSAGEFVVKILGQPDQGFRGALYEFVASRLAEHFGILVPEPAAIGISQEFSVLLGKSQPHLAASLKANVGLNFGTRVINPMSIWLVDRTIPEAMLADAAKVYAFDALIQNPDRRVEKPNLFTRGDDLFVFDHESGFSFLYAIGVTSPPWNLERDGYLRKHVFHSRLKSKRIDLAGFQQRLDDLTQTKLKEIKDEVPVEWMHGDLNLVETHLTQVRAHAEEFIEQVKRSLV